MRVVGIGPDLLEDVVPFPASEEGWIGPSSGGFVVRMGVVLQMAGVVLHRFLRRYVGDKIVLEISGAA